MATRGHKSFDAMIDELCTQGCVAGDMDTNDFVCLSRAFQAFKKLVPHTPDVVSFASSASILQTITSIACVLATQFHGSRQVASPAFI